MHKPKSPLSAEVISHCEKYNSQDSLFNESLLLSGSKDRMSMNSLQSQQPLAHQHPQLRQQTGKQNQQHPHPLPPQRNLLRNQLFSGLSPISKGGEVTKQQSSTITPPKTFTNEWERPEEEEERDIPARRNLRGSHNNTNNTNNGNFSEEEEDMYEPETLLERRELNGMVEYLVKWIELSPSLSTWEPAESIQACAFDLIQQFENSQQRNNNNNNTASKASVTRASASPRAQMTPQKRSPMLKNAAGSSTPLKGTATPPTRIQQSATPLKAPRTPMKSSTTPIKSQITPLKDAQLLDQQLKSPQQPFMTPPPKQPISAAADQSASNQKSANKQQNQLTSSKESVQDQLSLSAQHNNNALSNAQMETNNKPITNSRQKTQVFNEQGEIIFEQETRGSSDDENDAHEKFNARSAKSPLLKLVPSPFVKHAQQQQQQQQNQQPQTPNNNKNVSPNLSPIDSRSPLPKTRSQQQLQQAQASQTQISPQNQNSSAIDRKKIYSGIQVSDDLLTNSLLNSTPTSSTVLAPVSTSTSKQPAATKSPWQYEIGPLKKINQQPQDQQQQQQQTTPSQSNPSYTPPMKRVNGQFTPPYTQQQQQPKTTPIAKSTLTQFLTAPPPMTAEAIAAANAIANAQRRSIWKMQAGETTPTGGTPNKSPVAKSSMTPTRILEARSSRSRFGTPIKIDQSKSPMRSTKKNTTNVPTPTRQQYPNNNSIPKTLEPIQRQTRNTNNNNSYENYNYQSNSNAYLDNRTPTRMVEEYSITPQRINERERQSVSPMNRERSVTPVRASSRREQVVTPQPNKQQQQYMTSTVTPAKSERPRQIIEISATPKRANTRSQNVTPMRNDRNDKTPVRNNNHNRQSTRNNDRTPLQNDRNDRTPVHNPNSRTPVRSRTPLRYDSGDEDRRQEERDQYNTHMKLRNARVSMQEHSKRLTTVISDAETNYFNVSQLLFKGISSKIETTTSKKGTKKTVNYSVAVAHSESESDDKPEPVVQEAIVKPKRGRKPGKRNVQPQEVEEQQQQQQSKPSAAVTRESERIQKKDVKESVPIIAEVKTPNKKKAKELAKEEEKFERMQLDESHLIDLRNELTSPMKIVPPKKREIVHDDLELDLLKEERSSRQTRSQNKVVAPLTATPIGKKEKNRRLNFEEEEDQEVLEPAPKKLLKEIKGSQGLISEIAKAQQVIEITAIKKAKDGRKKTSESNDKKLTTEFEVLLDDESTCKLPYSVLVVAHPRMVADFLINQI